ncbi:MAG: type II toxin-antitoxin system PemK/MazF family toxin [Dehalococcoidia bacterium]
MIGRTSPPARDQHFSCCWRRCRRRNAVKSESRRGPQVGRRRRPVLVLTRSEVLDVGVLVTVAEITTSMSGLAAEGPIDHTALGFDGESVIHCDGLHTVPRSRRPRSSLQRAAKPCSESVGQ